MENDVTVRKPRFDDFAAAALDLCSLRTAPPALVSLALLVVLTGSLVVALLAVALVSYVHAFWARLVQ